MEHFLLIFTTYTKLNLEVASDGVSLHIASTHTKKMSYRKRHRMHLQDQRTACLQEYWPVDSTLGYPNSYKSSHV